MTIKRYEPGDWTTGVIRPDVAAVDKLVEGLKTENERLRREVTRAEEVNASLQKDKDTLTALLDDAHAAMELGFDEVRGLEKQVEELTRKLETVTTQRYQFEKAWEIEVADLKRQLEATRSKAYLEGHTNALKIPRAEDSARIADLEKQLAEAKAAGAVRACESILNHVAVTLAGYKLGHFVP